MRAVRWAPVILVILAACRAPTPPPDAGSDPDAGTACLSASPASIDFGEIDTGSRGSTFVRITNTTGQEVLLGSTPSEDPFTTDVVPERLPPNGSVLLGLRFFPTDALLHFASLEFSSSAGCTLEVPVRGLGAGSLTVSPRVLDFGPVDPGKTRSLELSFSNTRRTEVVFEQIRLLPINGTGVPFTLGFTAPLIIPPTTTTTLSVTAAPPDFEQYASNLTLSGPTAFESVHLQVAGGAPIASLTPAVIVVPKMDFTAGSMPASFVERSLIIKNEATDAGSFISNLQVVLPVLEVRTDDGGLSTDVNFRAIFQPLPAGEQEEFVIQVRPPSSGVHHYQLTFFTNDPDRPELRVDVRVNAISLPTCSLQHVQRVDFTAAPEAGSVGMVRFTNASGIDCVLDAVRIAQFSNGMFRVIDGGIDQLELTDGQVHDVWLAGPDAGTGHTSMLTFHVLGPNTDTEGIELVAPR